MPALEAETVTAALDAVEPIATIPVVEPLPAPRLLPKVPFRFCLHPGTDRQWMQLEGGTPGLVPDVVRVIDGDENVVEVRLTMPLAPGQGHTPKDKDAVPPLVWVVVGIPHHVAAAIEAGLKWGYSIQAKVNDEWVALDLVDSGCRLGRARATSASS